MNHYTRKTNLRWKSFNNCSCGVDDIHLKMTTKYVSLLLWHSQLEFSLNCPILLDKRLVVKYIILKYLACQTNLCCLEVWQKSGWCVILSSSYCGMEWVFRGKPIPSHSKIWGVAFFFINMVKWAGINLSVIPSNIASNAYMMSCKCLSISNHLCFHSQLEWFETIIVKFKSSRLNTLSVSSRLWVL